MNGLSKDEIQHVVDHELLHLDGYKRAMPIFDDYDPAIYGTPVPRDQFILASGHIDQTAIALAQVPHTLVLTGTPGLGKSYHVPQIEDRMIHIQYSPLDPIDLGDYRYLLDEPYVGERRVNKARKIKDRNRNKAARKARRAGR